MKRVLDPLGEGKDAKEKKYKAITKTLEVIDAGIIYVLGVLSGALIHKATSQPQIITETDYTEPPKQMTLFTGEDGGLSYTNLTAYSVALNDSNLHILSTGSPELTDFLAYLNNSDYKLDLKNSSVKFDRFGGSTVELVQEGTGNKIIQKYSRSDTLDKLKQIEKVAEVNLEPPYQVAGKEVVGPVTVSIRDQTMIPEIKRIVYPNNGAQIGEDCSGVDITDKYNATFKGNYSFNMTSEPKIVFLCKDNKSVMVSETTLETLLAYLEDKNASDSDFKPFRDLWKSSEGKYIQGMVDATLTPDNLVKVNPQQLLEAIGYLESRSFVHYEYNESELKDLINKTGILDLEYLLDDWTHQSKVLIVDTPDPVNPQGKDYGAIAVRVDGDKMVRGVVALTDEDLDDATMNEVNQR